MPTQPYMLDGRRVPSVTTVLGRFDGGEGLIHWAWDLGRQGLDYRERRQAAADAGTLAHAVIEAHIRETEMPSGVDLPDEVVDGALEAYGAYLDWRATTGLVPHTTECSLVSRLHAYGGTFDALGRDGGELVLVDWKTSKNVYPKYVAQLGAYAGLWTEHHPEQRLTGGWVLLFSREGKGFRAFHYSEQELLVGLHQFLLLRAAYDDAKAIEKFYRRDFAEVSP